MKDILTAIITEGLSHGIVSKSPLEFIRLS